MPCKKMRSQYNWTPNDYEMSFDTTLIPSNIDIHNTGELSLQLQSRSPLGKVIHLVLDEENTDVANTVELFSEVSLTFENKTKEVKIR